jgi:hypothetical protein
MLNCKNSWGTHWLNSMGAKKRERRKENEKQTVSHGDAFNAVNGLYNDCSACWSRRLQSSFYGGL